MMRVEFLQFLDAVQIVRLAMTCKDMNSMIDPKTEFSDHFKRIILTQLFNAELLKLNKTLTVDDFQKVFGEDET